MEMRKIKLKKTPLRYIGDYHSRPGNAKVIFIHTKVYSKFYPDIHLFCGLTVAEMTKSH